MLRTSFVIRRLSDDENRRLFGKCVNLHGHNYALSAASPAAAHPRRSRINLPCAAVVRLIITRGGVVLTLAAADRKFGWRRGALGLAQRDRRWLGSPA